MRRFPNHSFKLRPTKYAIFPPCYAAEAALADFTSATFSPYSVREGRPLLCLALALREPRLGLTYTPQKPQTNTTIAGPGNEMGDGIHW